MELKTALIIIFALLTLGNLAFLDFRILKSSQGANPLSGLSEVPATLPSGPASVASGSARCGDDCQSYINIKLNNLKAELLRSLNTSSSTVPITPPVSTPAPTAPATTYQPSVYYVNFGVSGSTQATNYTDVSGSQISFNSADYPGAKAFYFQANLKADAPDRSTWARLWDSTHTQVVINSEITVTGLTSTLVTSSALNFSSGASTIGIQIHSLNGNWATVEGPRIKVVY